MIDKLTTIDEDKRGMTGIGVLILFIALVLVAAIASGLILDTAGLLQNKAQNTGEQSTSEVSDRLSVLSTSGDVAESDNLEVALTDSYTNADITTKQSTSAFTVSSGERVDKVGFSDAVAADGDDTVTVELYNETADNVAASDTISVDSEADDYVAEFSQSDIATSATYSINVSGSSTDFSENLGTFGTVAIKDDDSSIPVLNSRDDRASIDVGLYHSPTGAVNGEPSSMDYLAEGESATLRMTTQQGATTTEIVNVPESLAGYDGSTVML